MSHPTKKKSNNMKCASDGKVRWMQKVQGCGEYTLKMYLEE